MKLVASLFIAVAMAAGRPVDAVTRSEEGRCYYCSGTYNDQVGNLYWPCVEAFGSLTGTWTSCTQHFPVGTHGCTLGGSYCGTSAFRMPGTDGMLDLPASAGVADAAGRLSTCQGMILTLPRPSAVLPSTFQL